MILQAVALAWLAGAGLGAIGAPLLPYLAIPFGVLIGVWQTHHQRTRQAVLFILALGAVASAGALAFNRSRPTAQPDDVSHFIDVPGPKRVQGVVNADRDETASALLLRLAVQRVETDAGWQPATGTLLVRAPLSLAYDYGDQIEVRGKLVHPPQFRDFDYEAYLAQQGIYAEVIYPSTHLIAQNQGTPVLAKLVHLREQLAAGIKSVLPEPEASLGAAIALGTTHGMDPQLKSELMNSGATWIVTGAYKVTLAGILVTAVLMWLFGRRVARLLSVPSIVGYAAVAGFYPSDIRAASAGVLFATALFLGRPHSPLRLLLLAAGMLAIPYSALPINVAPLRPFGFLLPPFGPQVLADSAFVMSIATVAALFILGDPLARRLSRLLPGYAIGTSSTARLGAFGSGVAASLVASAVALVAAPALFRQLPVSLPAASILLTPLVPVMVGVSAAVAAVSTISHPAALVLAPVAYAPLWIMVMVARLSASVSGGNVAIPRFASEAILAACALGGAAVGTLRQPRLRAYLRGRLAAHGPPWHGWLRGTATRLSHFRSRFVDVSSGSPSRAIMAGLALPVLAGAAVLLAFSLRPAGDPVRVTVLDVGPGNAMLIQAYGRRVLVEGGPPGDATLRALDGRLAPWQRSLALVVITDTTDAHAGGLPAVLAHYRVGAILDASPAPAANKPAAPAARALALSLGTSTAVPVPAMPWTSVSLGTARLVIEQTPAVGGGTVTTVTLEAGRRRFLLAGDVLGVVAADVRLLPPTNVQTPLQLPGVAVLESGAPSRAASSQTGVPAAFERGLLYRTQEDGAITLSTDGQNVRVSVARGDKLGLLHLR